MQRPTCLFCIGKIVDWNGIAGSLDEEAFAKLIAPTNILEERYGKQI